MLYMVIEHFRSGDPVPVYQRFRSRGRQVPHNVKYVASWVAADLTHCYQVMEAPNRENLQIWIDQWQDLVEFEVTEMVTSVDAASMVLDLGDRTDSN